VFGRSGSSPEIIADLDSLSETEMSRTASALRPLRFTPMRLPCTSKSCAHWALSTSRCRTDRTSWA
jgi:hypothetical protein